MLRGVSRQGPKKYPIWPLGLIIGILAIVGLVALLNAVPTDNGPTISAQAKPPVAQENPAPKADLARPPRLTQAEKADLLSRFESGQAAVISSEPAFATANDGKRRHPQSANNAFVRGQLFLRGRLGHEELDNTAHKWYTNIVPGKPLVSNQFQAPNTPTQELLPNTQFDIAYHITSTYAGRYMGETFVTVSFKYEGDEITPTGFKPQKQ